MFFFSFLALFTGPEIKSPYLGYPFAILCITMAIGGLFVCWKISKYIVYLSGLTDSDFKKILGNFLLLMYFPIGMFVLQSNINQYYQSYLNKLEKNSKELKD